MEGERTPLLHANSQQDNSLNTRSQQDNSIHTIGSEDNSIHTRSQEWDTSSPLLTNEHQDTDDLTANPSNCSRWRNQLVGIELAGCLHSFSNGMHMVCYQLLCVQNISCSILYFCNDLLLCVKNMSCTFVFYALWY